MGYPWRWTGKAQQPASAGTFHAGKTLQFLGAMYLNPLSSHPGFSIQFFAGYRSIGGGELKIDKDADPIHDEWYDTFHLAIGGAGVSSDITGSPEGRRFAGEVSVAFAAGVNDYRNLSALEFFPRVAWYAPLGDGTHFNASLGVSVGPAWATPKNNDRHSWRESFLIVVPMLGVGFLYR